MHVEFSFANFKNLNTRTVLDQRQVSQLTCFSEDASGARQESSAVASSANAQSQLIRCTKSARVSSFETLGALMSSGSMRAFTSCTAHGNRSESSLLSSARGDRRLQPHPSLTRVLSASESYAGLKTDSTRIEDCDGSSAVAL